MFEIIALFVLAFGFVVFFGAPYVPSKRRELDRIFKDLYKVGPKDMVIDLGSGDGVVLRAAAKCGARAVGYELNPLLVLVSRILSRGNKNIRVQGKNMWHVKLPPETTLVYVFAVSRDIEKLARKLQYEANRLGRSLPVISYGCEIPYMTSLASLGAHHLYTFTPLHTK